MHADVTPRLGHPLTTFRIRFEPREFIGRQHGAIAGYEARLLRHPFGLGCITDTGGFVNGRGARPEIVLDPREEKGGHFCRGHFRGRLTYYLGFACPDDGVCRRPKNVRERRQKVARLEFEVR